VVADVSFISLTKVLPAITGCAADRFDCLALVKPQFEVGRELVGKGGVVRSAGDRRAALVKVGRFAREELGLSVVGFAASGLPGPAGNRESFLWLAERGRDGALDELEPAARRAEP
jgi:23S rRNA (cytidine1920-2'-O)/16S rRNA (cytidine1409-2'-O)-methyltransferase